MFTVAGWVLLGISLLLALTSAFREHSFLSARGRPLAQSIALLGILTFQLSHILILGRVLLGLVAVVLASGLIYTVRLRNRRS